MEFEPPQTMDASAFFNMHAKLLPMENPRAATFEELTKNGEAVAKTTVYILMPLVVFK
jgi:hypothetical protein